MVVEPPLGEGHIFDGGHGAVVIGVGLGCYVESEHAGVEEGFFVYQQGEFSFGEEKKKEAYQHVQTPAVIHGGQKGREVEWCTSSESCKFVILILGDQEKRKRQKKRPTSHKWQIQ